MHRSARHWLRRDFLQHTVAGSLLCSLAKGWSHLLAAQGPSTAPYDLLVKGGRVVDPAQELSAERDVAISGNRVARIAPSIAEKDARHVV